MFLWCRLLLSTRLYSMTFGDLILQISALPTGSTFLEHLQSVMPASAIAKLGKVEVFRGGEAMGNMRGQAIVQSNSVQDINNALRRVSTASDRFVTELDTVANKVSRLQGVVDSLLRKSGQ